MKDMIDGIEVDVSPAFFVWVQVSKERGTHYLGPFLNSKIAHEAWDKLERLKLFFAGGVEESAYPQDD